MTAAKKQHKNGIQVSSNTIRTAIAILAFVASIMALYFSLDKRLFFLEKNFQVHVETSCQDIGSIKADLKTVKEKQIRLLTLFEEHIKTGD